MRSLRKQLDKQDITLKTFPLVKISNKVKIVYADECFSRSKNCLELIKTFYKLIFPLKHLLPVKGIVLTAKGLR